MPGVTLDTGALIAIDRGDRRLQALIDETVASGTQLAVPAGVVAQSWRGSARPARLARFLALGEVVVVALDEPEARASGVLCARAGSADVLDASVVICARRRGHAVVTGDPADLAELDPRLKLVPL